MSRELPDPARFYKVRTFTEAEKRANRKLPPIKVRLEPFKLEDHFLGCPHCGFWWLGLVYHPKGDVAFDFYSRDQVKECPNCHARFGR